MKVNFKGSAFYGVHLVNSFCLDKNGGFIPLVQKDRIALSSASTGAEMC